MNGEAMLVILFGLLVVILLSGIFGALIGIFKRLKKPEK